LTIKNRLVRVATALITVVVLAGGVRTHFNTGREADASQGPAGFPAVTAHSDLDAFVSEDHGPPSRGPVVFVGIDGASWEFINPLIERGVLPNLARIKNEGAFATLQSIPCYVSPPAWTTMFTGGLPQNSGVYSFGKWDAKRQEFISVNGDDVRLPRVWDVASYCGRRVGVFNVPMTYPPRPVHGVVVSGMMTPHEIGGPVSCQTQDRHGMDNLLHRGRVENFSPVARVATTDSLNTYLWSLYDTIDDRLKGYDTVVLTVASGEDRIRSYTFEVGEFSQWIRIRAHCKGKVEDAWCKFAITRTEDDRYETRISPTFFAIDETYTFPDGFAKVLQDKFGYYVPSPFVASDLVTRMARESAAHAAYFYNLEDWGFYAYVFTQSDRAHHLTGFSPQAVEVYRTIDRFVGMVMETMDDSGTLIVASDHGFGRYRHGIDLNHFFEERGLLERRDDGSIDYDRTLVFHHIWHLYFNERLITRDELARQGIHASHSDDPLELFGDYLRRLCQRISPGVGVEVTPVARDGNDNDPHMRVDGANGEYLVDFLGVDRLHDATIRELDGSEAWGHVREGIFMAWGNGIRRGHDLGVENIQDIAPTMLYMLGLPVAFADGAPIASLFEKRFVATRAFHVVDDYSQISDTPGAQKGRRETLEKTLRTLGYLQ
jgi:predicted AlkP superfamily phosphohydrolase/phosphomutase